MLFRSRKIKEAIYINICNKGKQIGLEKIMNIEKGFEIDSCWTSITNEMDFSEIMSTNRRSALQGLDDVDTTALETEAILARRRI